MPARRRSALLAAVVLLAPLTSAAHPGAERIPLEPAALRASLDVTPDSWAYIRYTAGLGKGAAEIEGPSPVRVGEEVELLTLRYAAGEEGIAPEGHVAIWFPVGCTTPQSDHAEAPGYLEARAGGRTLPLRYDYLYFSRAHRRYARPNQLRVAYAGLPEGLEPGGEVTFRWHRAEAPMQARQWEADKWLFRVMVDHDGDGWEEEIAESPWLPLIQGPATGLRLHAQSTAAVGESVRLTLEASDAAHNPAKGYRGTVAFAEQPNAELPAPYRFLEQDQGSHTFSAVFTEPGYYWVAVEDAGAGLRAESNPIEVAPEAPERRLFWGDLHVHTERSSDAINWAQSPPSYRGAYQIGRYRAGLDFMAVTDHHGGGRGNYSPVTWERMQGVTNSENDPGAFVTLVAIEQSGPQGDQNVYWRGDSGSFPPDDALNPPALWAHLRRHDREYFTVPHHVAQSMRPWQWDHYDPQWTPVVEIFSNHGRAEFHGNEPHYSHHEKATLDGHTWRDQLDAGKKLGCIACSDDHTGVPGTFGLTGVWAEELTREAVYDRIEQRHVYGTTNARCILRFGVNGEEMGSEVAANEAVLRVEAAAPSQIERITVVKDGEDARVIEPGARVAQLAWTDPALDGPAYYYVRVRMAGEPGHPNRLRRQPQFAWSSPVWVRPVSVK